MADIAELERRITAALDRIGAGLERLDQVGPAVDPAEMDALREALEAEKMANAQLEARIAALHEKSEARVREIEAQLSGRGAELEAENKRLMAELQEARGQLRHLRQANQQLQASVQALREAAENGIEPHMINQAMMSELEGLRAARDADRAEVDALLGALEPMLEEKADA